MSKVFVIQDANGKNLSPAREYGEIHVILSGKESPDVAQSKLQDALSRMTKDDYLLLIGHPINIVLASYIALTKLRTVNFLVWDRIAYKYEVEKIIL